MPKRKRSDYVHTVSKRFKLNRIRKAKRRIRANKLTTFRPTSAIGPFTTKKKTLFHFYEEGIDLNPSVGTLARFPIQLNNPVRPDSRTSVASHQPREYNVLSKLYDHAVVIFATLEVFFQLSPTTYPAQTYICAITVRDASGNTGLNTKDQMEYRTSKRMILTLNSSKRSMKISANPNKYLGISKALSDPRVRFNLEDTNTPNPQLSNDGCWAEVSVQPVDSTLNAPLVSMSYRLTQVVICTEPKKLSIS